MFSTVLPNRLSHICLLGTQSVLAVAVLERNGQISLFARALNHAVLTTIVSDAVLC